MVYIVNGILLRHKKESNNAVCSDMDRSGSYHTEWSKLERGGQISHEIACMWNLKRNGACELIYKTETDSKI